VFVPPLLNLPAVIVVKAIKEVKMKAICLAPAFFISVLAASPAASFPAGSLEDLSTLSPVILAQGQNHIGNRRDHTVPRHHRYVPGHKYHRVPHRWHSYHQRPGDWYHRGCIIVGELWYCP
jgi:hypothetical protein